VFGIAVGLQALLLRSTFGCTMLPIRENERRARFLGIAVERHIWLSFSISCFFTALAGSLYALLNHFAGPLGLNYTMPGNIVMITVMGGMRAFWGPLLGAVLFVMPRDYISSMTVNWMFFAGVAFVAVVLFFPRGLPGMLQRRSAARRRTSAASPPSRTSRCASKPANRGRSLARMARARPRSST
jgi:branched-chain amino acid transport system permease protein